MNSRIALVILLALVCIAIVALVACTNRTAEDEQHLEAEHHEEQPGILEISKEGQAKAGLVFVEAKNAEISNVLHVSGRVVPDESRVVHVRPLATGRVERIFVQPGGDVRAGQPLVAFDYVELGDLESAYRKARAEARVAEQAVQRAEELTKIGALAEAEYQRRKADYESTLSAAREYEIKLRRFNVSPSDLESGTEKHSRAAHSVLRSPRNGVLLGFDASVGEAVDPASELFTICDLSSVWVEANVHETDLSAIDTGREALIQSDAYPGRIFKGKITKIGDVLDVATRTVKVRSDVANADKRLKLEMFVDVVVPTTEARTALLIPPEAIQEIDHKPVAFVKKDETHFEKRNIETGEKTERGVEVTSGLNEREVIVTQGSFSLKSEFLKAEIGSDEHGH
jgi:cobalt-zinc-cadmium efflux system membrane fusion protein